MKLVIIGGDAAGMSAASQAKRQQKDADVIVFEKTKDVSYGACGLPYKLVEGTSMDELQVISAKAFIEKRGIDLRVEHEVLAIDPETKKVKGKNTAGDFEEGYDKLLIATGASVYFPTIKGLDELKGQGVFSLKTLEDGRRLRSYLDEHSVKDAVILGAGYIALETAENLVERGISVSMVKPREGFLRFLSKPLMERVVEEARLHHVELAFGETIEEIRLGDKGRIVVETSKDKRSVDLVVIATGVKPASQLAQDAGLALGAANEIQVNDHLQTSKPDIYAAGDCADAIHHVTQKPVWIPLALRANRAGKIAGMNMLGKEEKAPSVMGTAVFKFFDLEIATTGLSLNDAKDAGFDAVEKTIKSQTRAHYYPGGSDLLINIVADKKTRRILGASMIGKEAAAYKIDTVVTALYANLTVDDLYQLDLAYAPPFGPAWSGLLIAASQLAKDL